MWRVAFDEVEGLVRWARWEDGPWQLHAARAWDEHSERIDLRILFKESLGLCIKEDERTCRVLWSVGGGMRWAHTRCKSETVEGTWRVIRRVVQRCNGSGSLVFGGVTKWGRGG